MVEVALKARSPLAGLPGHSPADQGNHEERVRLVEQPAGWVLALLARAGQSKVLRDRAQIFGIELPDGPHRLLGRDAAALGTGPDQWLVQPASEAAAKRLLAACAAMPALCSAVPVDDGRLVVAISGEKARDTLAKIVTVDLHPRAFRPGDVAVTCAAGVPMILWLRDDDDAFELAMPRSMARDVWDWLIASAAEYGCTAERAPEAP